MLSAVISSHLATLRCHWRDNRYTRVRVHPVLITGAGPSNLPAPTADRGPNCLTTFKPSSRTSLNGEQPYPWDRLQPQDEMSRHRGANSVDVELLGEISLLSPEYCPLSDGPSIQNHRITMSCFASARLGQSLQLSTLMPLHYRHDVRP